MVIVVGVTAITGFSLYRTRRSRQLDSPENHRQFEEPPQYRSLFEPTESEIRQFARLEAKQLQKLEDEARQQSMREKTKKVFAFQTEWEIAPDKRKTLELLRLTTLCENAEMFFKISQSVIERWRENKIENLTAPDLADLLDSHFSTLPQQERTSGIGFRLKEEIAELRRKSEGKSLRINRDEEDEKDF